MLTVGELIEQLKQYDPATLIVVPDPVVWVDTARASHTLCVYAKNSAHAVKITDDWAGEALSSVESTTKLETDWANCPNVKD